MTTDSSNLSRVRTQVLRAVRRRRALSAREVALRMGRKLRTYQYFEAGGGRLNLDILADFAKATGADLAAITNAILLEEPALALYTADTNLVRVALVALRKLGCSLQERTLQVEPRRLSAILAHAFQELEGELADRFSAIDLEEATRAGGEMGHV